MSLYESVFVTRQDLSKQDVTRLTEQFSGIVTEHKGKVVKTEYWGLRNLAYKINKNRKGHYTMLAIDATPETVKEVERQMGINEEIIRHMTVRVEKIDEAPSPMMQTRGPRDDDASGDSDQAA